MSFLDRFGRRWSFEILVPIAYMDKDGCRNLHYSDRDEQRDEGREFIFGLMTTQPSELVDGPKP